MLKKVTTLSSSSGGEIPVETFQVVPLCEIKDHLGITYDDDDQRLLSLLALATDFVERETQRALVNQVWDEIQHDFPRTKSVFLKRPPLQNVISISYYDSSNSLTTLSSTAYRVVSYYGQPGVIEVKDDWPTTFCRTDAVTYRYTAGSTGPGTVPEGAKHAIKMLVAHWNENREAIGSVGAEVSMGVQRLCDQLNYGRYN